MSTHQKSFSECLRKRQAVDVENASLHELLHTLAEWLWFKTSTDHFRKVLCCPPDGKYRICDFSWTGFYMSETELQGVCIEAVNDYALARYLGFEALSP